MYKPKSRKFFTTIIYVLFCSNAVAQEQPNDYAVGTMVNFVRTWDVQRPLTDDNLVSLSTNLQEVTQTTQYLDGLGRPLQTVSRATSPLGKDMVAPVVYDPFGREQLTFLPYVSSTVADGNFKLTPFLDQKNFYNDANTKSPVIGQGETYYYGKNIFEASPLNKLDETQAPGNSWVGSGRGIKIKHFANTDIDEVKMWVITDNPTAGNFGSYSVLSTNPIYAAGQLYKIITIDEAGKQVIEFKDKEGKVILKKIQLTATDDDGSGKNHTNWLCTYYMYDDFNNLRCVLQPEGVEAINGTWVLTDNTILSEQCFRYEYDARNRMIMKKVPGAAAVNMIYDARDRLIMTQDGNMSIGGYSPKKWLVIAYDALNRPTKSGLLADANSPITHRNNTVASTTYPDISGSNFDLLTQTYYDDYSWFSSSGSSFTQDFISTSELSTGFLGATNTVFPYPQANNSSQASNKGLVTGTKVKLINPVYGTNIQYLYSVTFYDDKDRPIQTRSTNITGGTDKSTNQYSFDGKLLVNKFTNVYSLGTPQVHSLITRNTYTAAGRLSNMQKNIDSTGLKTILSNSYDELGQVATKTLAPAYNSNAGISNLTHDYNIRGWILGLNRSYVLTTNVPSSRKFGYQLGYDKLPTTSGQNFISPQYNGNISGVLWKSSGDGIRRKYDFQYDNANRLMKASFVQNNAGTSAWDKLQVDYTVLMGANGNDVSSAYTSNGNIKRMQQWGLEITASNKIDDLQYNYFPHSNKLSAVTEQGTGMTDHKLGDFTDKHTTGADYGYDVNGNLKTDLNKKTPGGTGIDLIQTAFNGISYNYLNQPTEIAILNDVNDGSPLNIKGSIRYTYDALGNKLEKATTEDQLNTITTYIGPFVYESKTTSGIYANDYTHILQFASHEEGRIRYKAADNTVTPTIPASYPFDYFIKDHLGNVRMMLTEEPQIDIYPAATLEDSKLATEQSYYDINTSQIVDKSFATAIPDYLNNNTIPNPPANASFDNANSAKVYKLNKNSQKMGLGVTLRVMSGDKLDIYGKSYYATNNTGTAANTDPINPLDILTGLLGGPMGTTNTAIHGEVTSSQLNGVPAGISAINTFLGNQTNTNNGTPTKPKAFINYVLFDDQFKCLGSGFAPVGANSVLTDYAAVSAMHNIPVVKNGFAYIYCSNESPVDVFFDNIQVVHTRGPILEETHYYPFGLTMAGISSKAAGSLINKKGFNGNEIQNKEFSDGSGLELYDFNARTYDQQTGRFIQIDPTPEDGEQEGLTPYHFSGNNPSTFNDPNGKCGWCDDLVEGAKAVYTATVATASVVVDNVLGTDITGTIANSGAVPTTQINNWNTAVTSANKTSLVAGTAATVGGLGVATGSAIVTVASGGTSAIVTGPAILGGLATAAVGTIVTANATKNLANGNGLIRDKNAPPGTYDNKPNATNEKKRVVNQKPGEKSQNQLEGIEMKQAKEKKNAAAIGEKQNKINIGKSSQNMKTVLKKVKNKQDGSKNF